MTLIVVTAVFTLAYLVMIVWLIRGWERLPEAHVPPAFVPDVSVCVVVPARNEAANIARCLDGLLYQQYPEELLEVIIVNDHSDDDTLVVAKRYEAHGFKVVDLKDYTSGQGIRSYKKLAIATAVDLTQATVIVTLDADCTVEMNWLMTLVAAMKRSGDICALGPVMIEPSDDFFAQVQALDVASLTGVAAATAGWDRPLVANGANMAFARAAYIEVTALDDTQRFTSGDDMFLLQKLAARFPRKITYCKSLDATVYTKAAPDFVSFFNQRLRWASKLRRFRDVQTVAVAMFVYVFDVLLLVNAAMAVGSRMHFNAFLLQMLVKCFADIFFLRAVVTFFNRRQLLELFLPAQLFRLVYVVLTGIGAWLVPVRWKGRKVYR